MRSFWLRVLTAVFGTLVVAVAQALVALLVSYGYGGRHVAR